MFKKKPNIKNLAPLRSSDRRKVTDQIISDYQIQVPKGTESNEQEDGEGQSSGIGALRNSLLPEGALSAKFTTTVGQGLKTVHGVIYVGAYDGQEPRVLWVKQEEKLVPTVYTLWRLPGIIPLLHTIGIVVEKMRGGADLMTPGLTLGPPFPAKATKGAIVAIASYENPSVPVIVGECEIDVASLATVRGSKGHAVRGLHWHGDEIWSWSRNSRPGTDPPDRLTGWYEDHDIENAELRAAQTGVEDLNMKDSDNDEDDGGIPVNGMNGQEAESEHEEVQREKREWTTKDVDRAFRNAFLYAMHNAIETRKSELNHGIEFPVQQSAFISTYILPYLPAFTPDDSANLQLKKTSWKNVKKFIKVLDKEKLLKSKERNGGETVILDVDFQDAAITGFVPFRLPRKETSSTNGTNAGGDSSTDKDNSIGQTLKRVQLLRPKEKIAPIFAPSSADSRSLYLPTELRPIITAYLESESLISPQNKRIARINPILANAVFDPSSAVDKEALAKGSVPRDVLIERIISHCCAPFYTILRNNETRDDVKPKSGTPPNIKITHETRTGSKTATKISGLEAYYVQPTALADELQKSCASSTSVNQLVGSSPKNPVMEIMVQGPQRDAVVKALEKRGVRKEWVEFLDKTKKKK